VTLQKCSEQSDLQKLYTAIIEAFDFQGNQMASFYLSDQEWNRGTEITLEDMGDESDTLTMASVTLQEIITESKQHLILVYDFINMWIFLIELVAPIEQTPAQAFVSLSVGTAPKESERNNNDFVVEELNFDTSQDDSLWDEDENFDDIIDTDFDELDESYLEY